jgi:hypothetical protein
VGSTLLWCSSWLPLDVVGAEGANGEEVPAMVNRSGVVVPPPEPDSLQPEPLPMEEGRDGEADRVHD